MEQWHEFVIGLYVEADTQQEAWDKISPALQILEKLDPEGEATVEHVGIYPVGGPLTNER